MVGLNETPVKTSRNFNINNLKLENIEIPEVIEKFENVTIVAENLKIDEECSDFEPSFGLSDFLTRQVNENSNQKLRLQIDGKIQNEVKIYFDFDEENLNLVENIEIIAKENSDATVIVKYEAKENWECYHNGRLRVVAEKNAQIHVIFVNLMNTVSNHFMTMENMVAENAQLHYTMIDFGGKNSVTNYSSDLIGNFSENVIDTIYLGKENQLFDLNYIAQLQGEKSKIDMEVQGALKDTAKKHFKGTIDFKKGCKKAKGNENEACMLLADTAKSIALPMLLCAEEDVEGNHSSSAGKIGEKELFYVMSRGLEKKEAMKLMVRAKFHKILEKIANEGLREYILKEIDERLD